ncbi:MAG: sigma-54 dependent transcriptional regulator [Smithella sp.]
MPRILVIDNDLSISEMMRKYFEKEGFIIDAAGNGTEGLNRYVANPADIVILDICLSDINGFSILEDLKEENESIKAIMITAHPDMETTIAAMKSGAFDYIHKPLNMDELAVVIKKAVKSLEMEKKIESLSIEPSQNFRSGDIIGTASEMREIFKMIGTVSLSRTTVLIQGESGTGKELVAKVIHRNTSPDQPFIAVNCSAIVETLLESELFGHEKGSFTGAVARKLGKFELARYGTVFLDEISEMSINLQAKLLRILQEMEFERVGGKDKIKVNARIMAATNRDLKKLVKEGKFRDDLFYRLNIVTIKVPPLRERLQDIPLLIDYLLIKINIELNKKIIGISDELMDIFMKYNWPGNVRELENLLVGACVAAKGQVLEKSDFQELSNINTNTVKDSIFNNELFNPDESGKILTLDEVEERYIRKIVRETNKNKGEICEVLGISRPTFERKLEKYRINFERE